MTIFQVRGRDREYEYEKHSECEYENEVAWPNINSTGAVFVRGTVNLLQMEWGVPKNHH